jgi:hypothetical protein
MSRTLLAERDELVIECLSLHAVPFLKRTVALGRPRRAGQLGIQGSSILRPLDPAKGHASEQAMLDVTPMGRPGKPVDITARHDDASSIAGELYINGDYTAR